MNGKDSDRFFDLDVFVWYFIMKDMNSITSKASLLEILYFIFIFLCAQKKKKRIREKKKGNRPPQKLKLNDNKPLAIFNWERPVAQAKKKERALLNALQSRPLLKVFVKLYHFWCNTSCECSQRFSEMSHLD